MTSVFLPSQSSEVNHDEWYGAWNDVGHGAFMVADHHCLDPGSSSADQIPPLRKQGRLRMSRCGLIALTTIALLSPALAQKGDVTRGQRDFQACAPCHSLEPDRNMTGPSLANLWGRRAGGLSSFDRYSDALKSSGIIW